MRRHEQSVTDGKGGPYAVSNTAEQTPQDFEALFRAWRNGDKRARDRLIEMNLGLVGTIVGRFCGPLEERDDLFQVGSLGLIKALERFDPALGFSFSTYAFHTILGEVRRYIRDSNPVRVSRSIKERAAKVRSFRARLSQTLGREPSIKELAAAVGVEESEVVAALEALAPVISLFEPLNTGRDDPVYLADRIAELPPDVVDGVALKQTIDKLPVIEREVLKLRYFEEMTQQEVAKRLGISQSQVSRIERAAILRMRQMLT